MGGRWSGPDDRPTLCSVLELVAGQQRGEQRTMRQAGRTLEAWVGPPQPRLTLHLAKGSGWSRGNGAEEGKEVPRGGDRGQVEVWSDQRDPGFSMTESSVQTGNFNKTLREKKKKKKKRVSLSRKNENTHLHMDSVGGRGSKLSGRGRKEGRGKLGQRARLQFFWCLLCSKHPCPSPHP